MTIDEMIAVLQGAKDGKVVQCRRRTQSGMVWLDAVSACWDFNDYDFRLKPEPREFFIAVHQSGSRAVYDNRESPSLYKHIEPIKELIHVREVLD